MRLFTTLSITTILTTATQAKLKLPAIFTDHMVLQRDMKVPVWGWTDANATVTVEFAGQKVTSKADSKGNWKVGLTALKVNKTAQKLTVSTSKGDKVEVQDVLVGEVWLASGQSNMEWRPTQSQKADLEAVRKTTVPTLRLFAVPRNPQYALQKDVKAAWTLSTPDDAQNFSAVGWFFGKHLHDELDVPVGIIRSAWGGSKIEPWINEAGYKSVKELKQLFESRQVQIPGTAEYAMAQGNYLKAISTWKTKAEAALKSNGEVPDIPKQPSKMGLGNRTTGLYQGMVHPVAPFALKGFIWYQGESNNGEGMLYTKKKAALINGWRDVFANPTAPFYFVQLAPYNYSKRGNLPEISFAQQHCLKIPHTGMAVTNDIGNPRDIHPRNKSEVGRRLALWALAKNYGKSDVTYSGPLYRGYKVNGSSITIELDHADGLKTRNGKAPSHFEIADLSGNWAPAKVEIKGNTVVLSSDKVTKPTQARYAWNQTAEPNLCNKAGLPAACFHTHWPINHDLGVNVAKGKTYKSSDTNRSNWDSGLTDGVWGNTSTTCYASGNARKFPKHVTIDLEAVKPIHAVQLGVPEFGSTKGIEVHLSKDGKSFTKVATHEFALAGAQQKILNFAPTDARYVRILSTSFHNKKRNYDNAFVFLSEVEAYSK